MRTQDKGPGDGAPPHQAERVRKHAVAARETAMAARESGMDARESGMDARESAASSRELSLVEREELAHLRDGALHSRERAAKAAAAQARLLDQMREANEKLVLATLRAEELAEKADATRLAISESEERFRSLVTTSAAVV